MKVTELEMIEALHRSGYILESEVAKQLSEWGFFVQSGPVVEDPITGKGREIDIIAESFGNKNYDSKLRTYAQIEYVFEIKNNSFPIILLNEFRDSPLIESWTGMKEFIEWPENTSHYDHHECYFDELIEKNKNIFTQYCSFHKKKANDVLMASHPERFHDSISKIIQHCDESLDFYENQSLEVDSESIVSSFFRHRLYMPILLVNDDVFQMRDNELTKVDSSTLVVNYYHKGEPKMAYLFIVTKDGLKEFINKTQLLLSKTITKMNMIKNKTA